MKAPTSAEQLYNETKPSKELSIEEIVKKDLKMNQTGKGLSVKDVMNILGQYLENGASFKRSGNTLFIVYEDNGGMVKYHSVNADPIKTLMYNALAFFANLHKEGKTKATTYFTGTKIKELLEKYKLKNQEILPSDDLEQGEFMLVTNLTRSA